jgi:type IV secretion system protein VirB9
MNPRVLVFLFLGSLLSVSDAEEFPTRGAVDARIRTAVYSADQLYRLQGIVGHVIELIFEDDERFVGIGGGDLQGVSADAHQNSVLLKPKSSVVSTNLVIFTTRRAYRVTYSVGASQVHRIGNEPVYAVRFIYPSDTQTASRKSVQQRIERQLGLAEEARVRNTNYWYCGRPSLRPVSAFDDGVHTRLTFSGRSEIPAIFVRNEDGSESLLNFSMDEGVVVIHRLAPKFILRRGKLTGCIVNKGFEGTGARLNTGTVSPAIERAVREPQP